MSREKGLASFSANFESQMAAPIDARMLVSTKADLVLSSTWQANDGSIYVYKGMIVSVHSDTTPENNGLYILVELPYTDINNWRKNTGGDTGISGYSGYSGYSGISGATGASGISGYSGASGFSGDSIIYQSVSGVSPNQVTKIAYKDNNLDEWIISTILE